ncbi:alpha/beta-hydrolase [Thozetella sp. PMI_491]|nr:alpha/beta-hydrolase [Thozetella sp. PMI_491]
MTGIECDEVEYFDLHSFVFQNGKQLPKVRLAFSDKTSESHKTAVIFTCFRGRIKSTLTLSDGALRGFRIIVIALFGNGESASPSNTPDFPESIDYRDCVRAQHIMLTRHLGIESVDVMMGFSMGGQCVYHWSLMHPGFAQMAVIICSSARTSLHNYQFLEGPKAALESSADYTPPGHEGMRARPSRGLRAFGKAYSAWLTSAEWFQLGLFKALGYESIEDWDSATTETNYSSWDADDLLSMLRMWQKGDISVCHPSDHGSLESALGRIKTRVLLMPCQTDQYFLPEASKKELEYLKDARLEIIPSVWGHLAGAGIHHQDTDWVDQKVAEFMRMQ